jgi:hypothetical protein
MQFDKSLLETTKRAAWAGRALSDQLLPVERKILDSAAQEICDVVDDKFEVNVTLFMNALSNLFRYSNHLYMNEPQYGSHTHGRILALCLLNMNSCNWERRVWDATLLKLVTNLSFPFGGNLPGIVAGVIHQLLKDKCIWQISFTLEQMSLGEKERSSAVQNTKTIDDWLLKILDLMPYLDGLKSIHKSLIHLENTEESLKDTITEIVDIEKCRNEEKRIDEALAYIVSPGLLMLAEDPDATMYRIEIEELIMQSGSKAAQRQVKWDVLRFERPPAVADFIIHSLGLDIDYNCNHNQA